LSRVALLTDTKTEPARGRAIQSYQAAAEALGLTLWPVEIAGPEDVEPAFAQIAHDHADGVVLGASSSPPGVLGGRRGSGGSSCIDFDAAAW
jgi:hypothetical protein